METYSRWRHWHQLLKTFIHCFVERDVFLFEATDLSSCISSLEMIGNLETSNSCGGFWFSSFVADSVDSGSRGFWAWEGRKSSKHSPKCTRKVGKSLECWSSTWRISLSSFKNWNKLNPSIFGGEKLELWKQKLQNLPNDTLCLSFSCNLTGYFKQALKSDWLFFFKCNFLIAWKKKRFRAKNGAIRE